MFFINEVFATETAINASEQVPQFQSFTATLVPLVIFIAIFYFLLIRPQQKRQKEHEKEVAGLKPNDKIITAGGIFGVVKKVKEKTLIIEIADNVDIEVLSETVSLAKDFDKVDTVDNSLQKEKKTAKKSTTKKESKTK